jgi:hypothetical protein
MAVELEETYPYLLRAAFREAVFYQLSFGDLKTQQLLSQAISYLSAWNPDFIIVSSGFSDCRPEAFGEIQKAIIKKYSKGLFAKLRKNLYNPRLIKYRQISRVTQRQYRNTLKRFKDVFSSSKIFWLEICCGEGYEAVRPGTTQRKKKYNKIIEDIYKEDYLKVGESLLESNGFNIDHIHWNKTGHAVVAALLVDKIKGVLESVE